MGGVIAAQSKVVVVEEDFGLVEVVQAAGDTCAVVGGGIARTSWPYGVGLQNMAASVGDDGGL